MCEGWKQNFFYVLTWYWMEIMAHLHILITLPKLDAPQNQSGHCDSERHLLVLAQSCSAAEPVNLLIKLFQYLVHCFTLFHMNHTNIHRLFKNRIGLFLSSVCCFFIYVYTICAIK